jgi:hypothetical protein
VEKDGLRMVCGCEGVKKILFYINLFVISIHILFY